MKVELAGDLEQAKEIEALMNEWTEALQQKDAELMAHYYSEDAKVYDLGSQTTSKAAYKELWSNCFPYFDDNIAVERKGITIHASEDMAFVYGYSRVLGAKTDDPAAKAWCRMTVCYQKVKDQWRVIHEHISMPIDFENNQPALIMDAPVEES